MLEYRVSVHFSDHSFVCREVVETVRRIVSLLYSSMLYDGNNNGMRQVLTGILVVGSISSSLRIVLSMLVCVGCIKLYGFHGMSTDSMCN